MQVSFAIKVMIMASVFMITESSEAFKTLRTQPQFSVQQPKKQTKKKPSLSRDIVYTCLGLSCFIGAYVTLSQSQNTYQEYLTVSKTEIPKPEILQEKKSFIGSLTSRISTNKKDTQASQVAYQQQLEEQQQQISDLYTMLICYRGLGAVLAGTGLYCLAKGLHFLK